MKKKFSFYFFNKFFIYTLFLSFFSCEQITTQTEGACEVSEGEFVNTHDLIGEWEEVTSAESSSRNFNRLVFEPRSFQDVDKGSILCLYEFENGNIKRLVYNGKYENNVQDRFYRVIYNDIADSADSDNGRYLDLTDQRTLVHDYSFSKNCDETELRLTYYNTPNGSHTRTYRKVRVDTEAGTCGVSGN